MKGLILAGGRGKRINHTTNGQNKCMLELQGHPIIENSLNYAADSDVEEIVIVVGFQAEQIINRYGIIFREKPIKYVIQWEQKGLVHAIECARDAIGASNFMLFLGDEILIKPKHKQMVEFFTQENLFGVCGIVHQDDLGKISRTYSIIQGDDGNIYRLIEKPKKPMNHWQGTGNCIFKNDIFKYIEVTPIHHERKEKELPDLIQCAINDGMVVKSYIICDRYVNVNSKEDTVLAKKLFKSFE